MYEADLWNLGTVFPDLEAQVRADKLATPLAIHSANQYIQQQVQAQVPSCSLVSSAAMTTRCCASDCLCEIVSTLSGLRDV